MEAQSFKVLNDLPSGKGITSGYINTDLSLGYLDYGIGVYYGHFVLYGFTLIDHFLQLTVNWYEGSTVDRHYLI